MLQQTRERNKRESEVCLFSPLMVFVHWGLIFITVVWFLFIPISQNSFFFLFLVQFHESGCALQILGSGL
jgi:hypothetical protein